MTLVEFLESLNSDWYRRYTVNVYTSDYIGKLLETFEFRNYKESENSDTEVLSYSDFSEESELNVYVRKSYNA